MRKWMGMVLRMMVVGAVILGVVIGDVAEVQAASVYDAIKATDWWKNIVASKEDGGKYFKRCAGLELKNEKNKLDLSNSLCDSYKDVCKKVKKKEGSGYQTAYGGVCLRYAEDKGDVKSGSSGSGSSSDSTKKVGVNGKSLTKLQAKCTATGAGGWKGEVNKAGNCVNTGNIKNFSDKCKKATGAASTTNKAGKEVCKLVADSSSSSGSGGSSGGSSGSGSGSSSGDEAKKKEESNKVSTSILGGDKGYVDVGDNGEGIFMVLNVVLLVMTYGVGALATMGIVIAGYQYLTAKDDAAKIQKAKDRILQVVIGLAMYALLWLILQFILPGGIFGDGSTGT